MVRERISMRTIMEVLRLSLEQKLSVRNIAQSCNLARSTVADYLRRARAAGVEWPLPEGMEEVALEARLFPEQEKGVTRPALEMAYIHNELKRKHVTLQLLWEEYRSRTPEGYGYSQFCQLYRQWAGRLALSLRQDHRAGEKLFVDYAGDTIPITDPLTGKTSPAQLFVAVWGASNYTYAEATKTQQIPDWILAHVHALEFFDGVPSIVVPDNTKAAVTQACGYDPQINLTYQELAEHYGFAVLPARSRKPKDKSKVEVGVLIAERWILAALRDRTFFCLAAVNEAIKPLLERLNTHPFKKLPGHRREAFERLDRPAMKPLPAQRYELAQWKKVGVNIDYHVEVDGHYYSVPYQLIRQEAMARYTRESVEIFHRSKRVAAHLRSHEKGRHTTLPEHRPPAHQKYLDWTPERLLSWAGTLGPHCAEAARQLMAGRSIPEQGFRPCLGLIRLGKRFGAERVDQACLRAVKLNIVSYRHIEAMLKNGRDKIPLPAEEPVGALLGHDNLRGSQYYQ